MRPVRLIFTRTIAIYIRLKLDMSVERGSTSALLLPVIGEEVRGLLQNAPFSYFLSVFSGGVNGAVLFVAVALF